jgi:hypothetical protein
MNRPILVLLSGFLLLATWYNAKGVRIARNVDDLR